MFRELSLAYILCLGKGFLLFVFFRTACSLSAVPTLQKRPHAPSSTPLGFYPPRADKADWTQSCSPCQVALLSPQDRSRDTRRRFVVGALATRSSRPHGADGHLQECSQSTDSLGPESVKTSGLSSAQMGQSQHGTSVLTLVREALTRRTGECAPCRVRRRGLSDLRD